MKKRTFIVIATWVLGSALSCSAAAPVEDVDPVDGPEPEETAGELGATGTGTVDQAMLASCSTASVRGLSLQIVDQVNCLAPNAVAEVPSRPNLTLGSATLPFMQAKARNALTAALDANPNKTLGVNSMLRTVAQQYLLHGWYERKRCGIPLAAKPGKSNHESGLALDTNQYQTWKGTLKARGFKWFGNADKFHFDYVGSGTKDVRHLGVLAFQMLWNANNPADAIDEDGDFGPATAARLGKSPAAGFPIGASCQ